jgi:hypothetical protein
VVLIQFTHQIITQDLIAPEDYEVVTPLTTLVALTGIDVDVLKQALGINEKVSLAHFDPVATMLHGSNAEMTSAQAFFTVQQSIFTVLQASGNLAISLGSDDALNTAAHALSKALESADNSLGYSLNKLDT